MGKANKAAWIKYFDGQSKEDQRTIAIGAIMRLIEMDEVRFRADDSVDKDGNEECLYWEACGEDLRIPF